MEVRLNKEEVVEAIKKYVGDKLGHQVKSIDDEYISGVTVQLGEPNRPVTFDSPGIKVTPSFDWSKHTTPITTTISMANSDTVGCNLSDLAPDTFGENK